MLGWKDPLDKGNHIGFGANHQGLKFLDGIKDRRVERFVSNKRFISII